MTVPDARGWLGVWCPLSIKADVDAPHTAKRNGRLGFEKLHNGYAGLCAILPPHVIHDRTAYENFGEVAEAMAGHDKDFTQSRADYLDTLCALIEAYEAELAGILGASLALGPMILRGERKLTVEHIKRRADDFKVDPRVFLRTVGADVRRLCLSVR